MSTRGAIAIGTPEKWEGVYNHYDSYPSWLGPRVWTAIRKGELEKLLSDHRGGFGQFPDRCYCHDPEHRDRPDYQEQIITSEDPDPLFIEWVYVYDLNANILYVLEGRMVATNPRGEILDTPKKCSDGSWYYGNCRCKHILVGSFEVTGCQPQWGLLEQPLATEAKSES